MSEFKMRVALGQFRELTDEMCIYIKQLGANDFLMNTPNLPGADQWEYEDLKALSLHLHGNPETRDRDIQNTRATEKRRS